MDITEDKGCSCYSCGMNALVVYDSLYGNTKILAEAIAKSVKANAVSVSDITSKDLEKIELLIVGSPINGWRPSEKMNEFLSSVKDGQFKNIKAAAFDTRVKLFIHGDAAGKISNALKKAGATIISKPMGFFVKGTEGPLLDVEKDRAVQWAESLVNSRSS